MSCSCGKEHYIVNLKVCQYRDCIKDPVHKFQTGLVYWQLCEEHFNEIAKREKMKTR